MTKLKFLGRGSAFNTKEGNTSAYIKNNSTMLLIDCGETVFSRLQESKLLEDVKDLTILITHLHPDHVGSLGSLIFYCKYILKITPKIIYPLGDAIEKMLKLQGVTDGYVVSNSKAEIFEKLDIDMIIVHPSIHVSEIESCSYELYFNNKEYIYYTGDTNRLDNGYNMIRDEMCKAIYVDTCLADYDGNVHLSLRELCETIPMEYRHKVYCMHLDCGELSDKAKEQGFNIVELL